MIITALHCITVPLNEPIAVFNVSNPTCEAIEVYDCLPNRYLQDIYGLGELKTAQNGNYFTKSNLRSRSAAFTAAMKRVNTGFGYYHWSNPGVVCFPNAANGRPNILATVSLEDKAAVGTPTTPSSEDSSRHN